MKITVNGEPIIASGTTLAALLVQLEQHNAKLATAVNETFVPASARAAHTLAPGDRVEILAPQQGG